MDVSKATIPLVSVIGLIATAFVIDARYLPSTFASEVKQAQQQVVQQLSQSQSDTATELRLELYREKLARLNAKLKLTQDEKDEAEFMRQLIAKLQVERLKK